MRFGGWMMFRMSAAAVRWNFDAILGGGLHGPPFETHARDRAISPRTFEEE
jgi:hypothetical protein